MEGEIYIESDGVDSLSELGLEEKDLEFIGETTTVADLLSCRKSAGLSAIRGCMVGRTSVSCVEKGCTINVNSSSQQLNKVLWLQTSL